MSREKKKERLRGGIIVGSKAEIKITRQEIYGEETLEIQMMYNKKKWRLITVYCRNIKEMFEELEERIKETEEENLIIRGDFNARTGMKGGPIWNESH